VLSSKMLAPALTVLVLGTAATASARPKKQSAERTLTPSTMCDGTPKSCRAWTARDAPLAGRSRSGQPSARNAPASPSGAAALPTSRHLYAHHS
jgi:hypothetical protein